MRRRRSGLEPGSEERPARRLAVRLATGLVVFASATVVVSGVTSSPTVDRIRSATPGTALEADGPPSGGSTIEVETGQPGEQALRVETGPDSLDSSDADPGTEPVSDAAEGAEDDPAADRSSTAEDGQATAEGAEDDPAADRSSTAEDGQATGEAAEDDPATDDPTEADTTTSGRDADGEMVGSGDATEPAPSRGPAARSASADTGPGRWSPLTALKVVDPRDFGAVGNGVADDTQALRRAAASLDGTGGIVFIADGLEYRTTDIVKIVGDHVKLWARSGRGAITANTGGAKNRQAIMCADNDGCGVYGLRLRSDATKRLYAREDSQVVFDGARNGEVVGVEMEGSASAAVFVYGGSRQIYVEGNYIHHNWSDSVHFTDGSRLAWVWDNTLFTESPMRGDDGIACVTYGDGQRCGAMEWWGNYHFGSDWGRGYSVVGGDNIEIHHNFATKTAAAGISVASEPQYDTPSSNAIRIRDNVLLGTGKITPHPGIIVTARADAITDVTVVDNLVVDAPFREAFRAEGATSNIVASNTSTSRDLLPSPLPTLANRARTRNTDVLKMRDRSFAPAGQQRGLYRIHVRRSPAGSGFEQRFEYVVAGPPSAIDRWLSGLADATVAHEQAAGGRQVVVVVSPEPVTVPTDIAEVTFSELRGGDRSGSLAGVWAALDY